MCFKAGFDGASSQKIYKQSFDDTNLEDALIHEESLFQSALVPLRLKIGSEEIWRNTKQNSSHFCRPLHLQFKKESKELSNEEFNNLKAELLSLEPFMVILENSEGSMVRLKVTFKIDFTMFDGKVINALTGTASTQSCNICGAKPSDMNFVNKLKTKEVNLDACKLGLSSLHCWIRGFEYILHLGYKLDNKKHQARTPEEKLSVQMRKETMQRRFKEDMGLVVDVPKQMHGNSNPSEFSNITGVNIEVIKRLHNILLAVTSGYHLNSTNFQNYCDETFEVIVKEFGWYVMPPSVHKLLVHGAQISDLLELPIGQYAEEALEAQNKELRNARLHHTAKISRLNIMKNQYHYMLIRTDPVISSISFVKHKSNMGKPLPDEVKALLK